MKPLEDINPLEDTAAYLKVSSANLAQMARDQRIGAMKIGCRWVFPKSVIEAYIEADTGPVPKANNFDLTDRSARLLARRNERH